MASMAAAYTVIFSSPTLLQHSFNPSQTRPHPSITSFKPIVSSKANPSNGVFIRNFCTAPVSRERRYKVLTVSSLVDGYTGDDDEPSQRNSDTGAAIDIKLPRRSLMVTFTCNQCSERTKRLINRLAYERGLVFVQRIVVLGIRTIGKFLQYLLHFLFQYNKRWFYDVEYPSILAIMIALVHD
ncbi:uncharacterized protein LOC101206910 isoform X2 [Cucumis sativus]|uniref:uncharacterized protein LOC101206910 isoform X2 n=1 Tax=Cucumis sativus TaxID=3659 RepID=UPI0012F478C8|nr:uncharacterized protein LOC101206910 isoform X2 [Cucumis sativus]